MSLMEPEEMEGLYVDASFKDTPYIWTADEYARTDKGDASRAWVVVFYGGGCVNLDVGFDDVVRVRAVR